MKKMYKKLTLSLGLAAMMSAPLMAEQAPGLRIIHRDGTASDMELAAVERIEIAGNAIKVVPVSGETREIAMADIDRIVLPGGMSAVDAIEDIDGVTMTVEGQSLVINGTLPSATVELYSLDGARVMSVKTADGAATVIDMSGLSSGIYVAVTGKYAQKILKQ